MGSITLHCCYPSRKKKENPIHQGKKELEELGGAAVTVVVVVVVLRTGSWFLGCSNSFSGASTGTQFTLYSVNG